MGSRAQYAQQGTNGQSQLRYSQGSRTGSGDVRSIQGGRMGSGAYVNSNRAKEERMQYIRQQQQLQQQQRQKTKRHLVICMLITWIVLVFNAAAIAGMHFRMQRMNEALRLMESQLLTGKLTGNTDGSLAAAETEKGMEVIPTTMGESDSGIRVLGQDYVNLCGLEYVDRPCERTAEQVIDRLDQLAQEDGRIAEILENYYKYPDKILEALANNPEMTDFVMGYLDSDGRTYGVLTTDEKEQAFPLFLQWDPRWGYGEYGDGSNIALAGCGPTCLSMALYYLTKDEGLTPDVMARYSMENGYYISGTGTAWALLQDVPAQYGLTVSQPKAEERTMKAALDSGSVIICSMGPGDFTAAGHFIVIYGYDKKGFLVNDPNCVARSRRSWSFSELKGQIKNVWVLGGGKGYEGAASVTDYIYDATDSPKR